MTRSERLRVVIATMVAMTVTGCGEASKSANNEAPTARAPVFEVTQDEDRGLQTYVTVEVSSSQNLRAVFDAVRADRQDEGGYFVFIDCATGGTSGAANRLATGTYAVGSKGEAVTDLDDGDASFKQNEGRTCPVVPPKDTTKTPDLESVVRAFIKAGLPAANPRENTGGCVDLGCSRLVTTDELSLYTFGTAKDRAAYVEAFGDDVAAVGPVVLSYAAARTPKTDRKRYEAVVRMVVGSG